AARLPVPGTSYSRSSGELVDQKSRLPNFLPRRAPLTRASLREYAARQRECRVFEDHASVRRAYAAVGVKSAASISRRASSSISLGRKSLALQLDRMQLGSQRARDS